MMRTICLAVAALTLMASSADAAIVDWQAELQGCCALRETVAPLLQAGEGISAVGRSDLSSGPRRATARPFEPEAS